MRHKMRWWWSLPLVHHRTTFFLTFLMLFPALMAVFTQENEINMPHQESDRIASLVEFWAKKIGNHIYHLSNAFSQYADIKTNFENSEAKLQENDGLQLVKEMATDVTNMMKFKVEAVKRIMNVAEEASLDKEYKQDEEVEYYNAKRLNKFYPPEHKLKGELREGFKRLTLTENSHFDGIAVNENHSSVHVPTNVYDKGGVVRCTKGDVVRCTKGGVVRCTKGDVVRCTKGDVVRCTKGDVACDTVSRELALMVMRSMLEVGRGGDEDDGDWQRLRCGCWRLAEVELRMLEVGRGGDEDAGEFQTRQWFLHFFQINKRIPHPCHCVISQRSRSFNGSVTFARSTEESRIHANQQKDPTSLQLSDLSPFETNKWTAALFQANGWNSRLSITTNRSHTFPESLHIASWTPLGPALIKVQPDSSYIMTPAIVHLISAPDLINAIRLARWRLDRTSSRIMNWIKHLVAVLRLLYGFLSAPSSSWVMDEKDPDLYDARLRSWYIEAANSPKDMIILLDVSGSMTGLRREIAKHVVLNILETLNENDFVNVFNFSVETLELVPCFRDTLVQANLENLGEFKKALNYGETKDIANFTQALTQAFELLHRYNKSGQGSQCNQAIMVVTDGAPYNFEEIFAKYNWPHLQVRMFTYLIGREETKVRDLNWMACANKGYFVHVTTLAEVREQVLKYIPVMARPLVMYQSSHPHVWTGVYADIAHKMHGYILDPKQTEWLWEVRERNRQMERTNHYRKLKKIVENKGKSLSNPFVLQDKREVEKFLEYGEFGLSNRDIARMGAERARKTRRERLRRAASTVELDHTFRELVEPTSTSLTKGLHRRLKRDVTVLVPKKIHDYDLLKWYKRLLREQAKLKRWYEDIRLVRARSAGQRQPTLHRNSCFGHISAPMNNITERVLVNESIWALRRREVRTANLLGVAGTDVPIREIEKLVPPYKLGVNGYSFMVNSNGYVLYHPDLRPVHEEANAEVQRRSRDRQEWFQDILKPNYNSVDFAEVELTDHEPGPRSNHSELLALTGWRDYYSKLRRDLIEQRGGEAVLDVKIHMDGMKRVVQRKQRYFTQKIGGTPFSLGIAMPEGYGKYKVHGQIELSRVIQDPRGAKAMDHFSTGNWTLHPDWVYCEYKYDQNRVDQSPEDLMKDFLSRAQKPHWKWRSTRTRPPPEPAMNQAQYNTWKPPAHEDDRRDNYYCDKDLVQSLLFDASVTNVYASSNRNMEDQLEGKNSVRHYFGMTTAFVATRSGLTRWIDLTRANPMDDAAQNNHSGEPHFMKMHNKAIDEVWYKRAVDYYEEDNEAYVYSVPFDAATRNPDDVLVTATRAIFIEENSYRKAPAAVVGVTIKHSKFVEYFKNETYKCPSYPSRDSNCKKAKTCESKSLDCYLLDDNGFIIASENDDDTGKFFGTLEGTIMESLVQSEVYKRVRIFDYQAVCLDTRLEPSIASILATPLQWIRWMANWMMGNIFWMLVKTHLYTLWDPNQAWAYTHTERDIQYPDLEEPPQDVFDYKEPSLEEPRSVDLPEYLADDGTEEVLPEVAAPDDIPRSFDYDNATEGSGEEDVLAEYEDVLGEIYYDIDGMHPDGKVPPDYDPPYGEEDGDFPSIESRTPQLPLMNIQLAYINKTHPRPCDKEVYLYKLQNHKLQQEGAYKPVKGKLSNCHTNGCGRPFSVQKVISTNLILVAVNNLCPCESRKVDIEPVEVDYNETMHCNRLLLQHFRKRPSTCYNYHPDEHEIKLCGGAGALGLPSLALLVLLTLVHIFNNLSFGS
nr:voltage-dependent calcium channel subunit alpha-2/delta-3-like [Cherax quadricarinatus]